MNKKHLFKALIGIVIIIVLLFGWVMFKLIINNDECISNPFTYSAKAAGEQGMDILCHCEPLSHKYAGFSYDKDGIYINEGYSSTTFINVSLLENFNGDERGEGVPQ